MEAFINVSKKDPQVQKEIKGMLEKYEKLSLNFQSKIGYDTLIQNAILKEIKILLAATLLDIYMELKMKISKMKDLETKKIIKL